MAKNKTRADLIDYCLRRLGSPVVEINIDDDQVEDRVDDAIGYYIQYHYHGTDRTYVTVAITTDMVAANALTMPPDVVDVLRIAPTTTQAGVSTHSMSIGRQSDGKISLNGVTPDASNYATSLQQASFHEWLFSPERVINFRYGRGTLTFDGNYPLVVGDKYVVECYVATSPATNTSLWNDMWLKEYTTALIKQQWGQNLSKYSGVQLPTGITLDGQGILAAGTAEKEALEERLRNEFQYPTDFFLG